MNKALTQEIGIEDREHFEKVEDPHVLESIRKAQVFAETIIQSKFSPAEYEAFAKIIRQFNTLYWELGIQTWMMTKWRGVPVFKPPTDLWIYQELIYTLRPDLIIETGTCAGGSALYLSDMLRLTNTVGKVLTIDIDGKHLHDEFLLALKTWPYRLEFVEGSSTEQSVIQYVQTLASRVQNVLVILDSDHSYEHVSEELKHYAPLVTKGSALIIEDTGNCEGAKQAVQDWYIDHRKEFKQDVMCEKFMLTFNRDGFFERIG